MAVSSKDDSLAAGTSLVNQTGYPIWFGFVFQDVNFDLYCMPFHEGATDLVFTVPRGGNGQKFERSKNFTLLQ